MDNKRVFSSFLNWVEVVGNRLPHPVALFFWLFIVTILLSWGLSLLDISASYTSISGGETIEKTVTINNLLTANGLRLLLTSGVSNFVKHPALGSVVVAMLGVGVMEGSGLITSSIKKIVLTTPKQLVSIIVVFSGVMANIASDAGYVVLVPLGAVVFHSFGRHPLAGIAAAFAGVSGGFSANLLIGTIDPLLGGISTVAAQIINSDYSVLPTANYFFMVASTFLITALGAFITDNIVEPRLGTYKGTATIEDTKLTDDEQRGLRYAGISLVVFIGILLWLVLPENAVLRLTPQEIEAFTSKNGRAPELLEILRPFLSQSIVYILMLSFTVVGVAYGFGAKTLKGVKDISFCMNNSMVSIASVLVIIFISGQFIFAFNQSNMGIIIAVRLADFLKSLGINGLGATVGLIFITAFVNLFMGSASAKWLILSPVFIPMFYQLGISPELTQAAYRIGDSSTNIISPLMTYFPVILACVSQYSEDKENTGMGSVIALMLPYSMAFLIAWTLFFIVWVMLGLPVGPGVQNFL